MKKNKIIGFLTAFACMALAAVIAAVVGALGPHNAKETIDIADVVSYDLYAAAAETDAADAPSQRSSAPTNLGGIDVSSYQMALGASVRYKTDDGNNGIRFQATLDAEAYEELEDSEESGATVSYGMIIVPADYIISGDITQETVFGDNSVYHLVDSDTSCSCGKKHVTGVVAEKLTLKDDTAILYGSLVNIKSANIGREFVGRAYIVSEQAGQKTYAFADYFGGDIQNNTRSMAYLVQLYLEENGMDDTLYNEYIDPLIGSEYKYTVNHYLPDNQGGYMTAPETEIKWGILNETVTATNIAKTELNVGGKYNDYVTTETANSVHSSTLYVNGKTVLKCYYESASTVDNVLFSASNSTDIERLQTANTSVSNRTSTVTEDVDPADGSAQKKVAKITTIDKNQWYDGMLYMGFDANKLNKANAANWDYLTVRMYISATPKLSGYYDLLTDSDPAWEKEQAEIEKITEVSIFNQSNMITKVALNEWVDVVISKAQLQGANNASAIFDKGVTATKDEFDSAFSAAYGSNAYTGKMFLNIMDYANKTLNDLKGLNSASPNEAHLHDVEISYYIDTITWGVDYTAPEISLVDTAEDDKIELYTDTDEVAFTPSQFYTVEDNILAKDMVAPNGVTHKSLVKVSEIVYEVNGNDRTEIIGDKGVYTLSKDKNYVLCVTAQDWSVTDIAGNVRTAEYEIEIISITTGFPIQFNSEMDNGFITTMRNGSTNNKTWLDTYEDSAGVSKSGVLKLETSLYGATSAGSNYGGSLVFNFTDNQADQIISAFKENDDFALSMTVCFDFATGYNYDRYGVNFRGNKQSETLSGMLSCIAGTACRGITQAEIDAKALSGEKIDVGKWYTLTFTKEVLEKYIDWADETQMRKVLKGETFFIEFIWNTCLNTTEQAPVTYYLDEINFSTGA